MNEKMESKNVFFRLRFNTSYGAAHINNAACILMIIPIRLIEMSEFF